jgi:hypothetical protein
MDMSGQLYFPSVWTPWKCPSTKKLDGSQSRSWLHEREKILFPLLEMRPQFLYYQARGLFAMPTALSHGRCFHVWKCVVGNTAGKLDMPHPYETRCLFQRLTDAAVHNNDVIKILRIELCTWTGGTNAHTTSKKKESNVIHGHNIGH